VPAPGQAAKPAYGSSPRWHYGREAAMQNPQPRTALSTSRRTYPPQRHDTTRHRRRQHRPSSPACFEAAPPPRPWTGRFGVRHLGPGGFTEIHTTSGTSCRSVRRHGPWPGWTDTESTFPTRKVCGLMPYGVRSATRGHRPLRSSCDAAPECRGGMRRWSG